MMKSQISWRILTRLPRMKQTELSQLLKKMNVTTLLGAAILFMTAFSNFVSGSDKIQISDICKP